MAQETKNSEEVSKTGYREFCSYMRRFQKEQAKKDSHSKKHLGYRPMSEFKKLKLNFFNKLHES